MQGETKQLRLYEERFTKLFDDVSENYEGTLGMGLLSPIGIMNTVLLAEVEAFNRMEGFGIFLTIRVVGRARIHDVVLESPYFKATCTELPDAIPDDLEE